MAGFLVLLQERNGEYEYEHKLLLIAGTQKQAVILAQHHAKTWYPSRIERETDEEKDVYRFFNGEIAVWVEHVQKVPRADVRVLQKYLQTMK